MTGTLRPRRLREALEFRAKTGAIPFAGGTDLMVQHHRYSEVNPEFDSPIVFLDAVEELRRIRSIDSGVAIGAATTLSEILEAEIPPLLTRAIRGIGGPALKNRATLGGNICNASPAGDTLPSLYVLEATLVLQSDVAERTIGIADFIAGPGETHLQRNELLTEIRIPFVADGTPYYRKVGTRRANAISKLCAAGFARKTGGSIIDFRFAIGAVAPTVVRLTETESLVKERVNIDDIEKSARTYLAPIDDQRSNTRYRTQVALNSLREFIRILEEEP